MDNLIALLKNNRYPFGMWPDPECYGKELGEAMQGKAKEVGRHEFQCYMLHGQWLAGGDQQEFMPGCTYRLRPDYEDEPEIRQMEIAPNNSNCLCMYNDARQSFGSIANVHERPDFIGFKFEDGGWYDAPIKPVGPDGNLWLGNITVDDIVSGRVKILDATSVLFRRKKQE